MIASARCWRPHFEGLLQRLGILWWSLQSCWRPHFEGLHNPEGKEPEYGYNIALDRIQSKPRERSMVEYVPAPKHFYVEFFKDIVGVSHMKDARKEHIVIRARSLYIYKLMDTPPSIRVTPLLGHSHNVRIASMQSSLLTLSRTTSFMVAYYRWEQDWKLFHQNLYVTKWLNECRI